MPKIAAHLLILGLDSCESVKDLKAAYNRKVKQWHPDLYHNDLAMLPTATENCKQINAAYEHLSELFEIGRLPRSTTRVNPPPTSKTQQAYRTQHTYNRTPFTTGFPDPNVFEVFVKSSNIISTGYNRANGTLYIKFEGDLVYAYLLVPESVFSDFLAAESHGKFAHRYIFRRYESVRY